MSARFDRYLTLSVFRPLHWAGLGNGDKCVPVLMYHSISNDPEPGVNPYYRLATSPLRFAEQMQWLHNAGYAGVSIEEAMTFLASDKPSSHLPVAITFDDGFRDFHTAAWPVLREQGFSATMYLPTAFIGSQRQSFRGKECLTWNEVRELRHEGARFGSHTVNHPKLHELSWKEIAAELAPSKTAIEQELAEEITSFAYPFAFPQEDRAFTKRLAGLLREQGYRNCATTVIGRVQPADDPFCLKRLPANSDDDEALFIAKLSGAYDWLGSAQRTVRQLKRWSGKSARRETDATLSA